MRVLKKFTKQKNQTFVSILKNWSNQKEKKLNKPYLVVQTFAERSQRDKVYENLRKEFEYANHININTLFESNPNKSSADMLSNDFEYLPCSYLWTRLLVYWDGTTTTC